MSHNHPLSRLTFSKRVAKRAQYEAFEFTLTPDGVCVRNGSHENPEAHEYTVTVTDGVPTACTCPADARFEAACKHRVGVAIRDPILTAAKRNVATDGGTTVAPAGADTQSGNEDEDCDECLDDFPCWECIRTGRRELPSE